MLTEFLSWLEQSHVRSRAHSALLCVSFGVTLVAGLWSTVNRQQLQRQQQRVETLQQVIGNLHSGMVVVDRGGVIREWNAAATKTFGWTADEAIGSDVAMLLPQQDQKKFRDEYQDLLSLGVTTGVRQLDCWGVTKTGEPRHVLVSVRVSQIGDDLFSLVSVDNYHKPRIIPACNLPPTATTQIPDANSTANDRN